MSGHMSDITWPSASGETITHVILTLADGRQYLAARPISTWNGLWQDMAAFEALESGGWRHWANGDRCDGLVPR